MVLPLGLALGLVSSGVGCGTSPEFADYDVEEPEVVYVPSQKHAPRNAAQDSLVGRWEGVGKQNNGSTWKMVLTIVSDQPGRCAKIEYPSLGCGGYWNCSGFNGAEVSAVEVITYGNERCVDEVDVHVGVDEDGQNLMFHAVTGDITAEALLGRSN